MAIHNNGVSIDVSIGNGNILEKAWYVDKNGNDVVVYQTLGDCKYNTLRQTLVNFPPKRKKPKGNLNEAVTDAYLEKVERTASGVQWHQLSLDGVQYIRAVALDHIQLELDPKLIEAANLRVASKIRNWLQSDTLNFADTIGEVRETRTLLEAGAEILWAAHQAALGKYLPAKQVLRNTGNLFRPDKNDKKYSLVTWRSPAAAWVIGQLAFAPLLRIAEGIQFQFSGDRGNISKRRRTFTATETQNYSDYVIDTGYAAGNCKLVCKLEGSISYKRKIVLWVEGDFGRASFAAGNPAQWLWAGTRFSFIVDWFVDVSSFLATYNALPPFLKYYGSTYDIISYDLTGTYSFDPPQLSDWASGPTIIAGGTPSRVLSQVVTRRALNVPVDIPMGGVLRFDPRLTTGKKLTALALITLLSKGKLKFTK